MAQLLREVAEVVVDHGVDDGLVQVQRGKHVGAVLPEPLIQVFSRGLLSRCGMSDHRGSQLLEGFGGLGGEVRLGHGADVQRVRGVRGRGEHLQCLLVAPEMAQHRRFEILRTEVERVGVDRAVREVKRGGHVAARGGDLRNRIITGGLPGVAPRGLVEPGERLIGLALGLEGGAEVVDRRGVFWRGVSVREPLQRFPQVLLRFRIAGLGESRDAESRVYPRVAGIAAHHLLPVRQRIDFGIVKLLGAETDEVEFLVGLNLLRGRRRGDWRRCRLGP